MTDLRHGSYVTYTQTDLVYMGLLKNMCGIKSMCEMEEQFNEENCIATLWRIILDGTGLFYFREKHFDNCQTKTITMENGTKVKTYYHKVVEAKLVLGEKIVISMDNKIIENETETVVKGGCEVFEDKQLRTKMYHTHRDAQQCILNNNVMITKVAVEWNRKMLLAMNIC